MLRGEGSGILEIPINYNKYSYRVYLLFELSSPILSDIFILPDKPPYPWEICIVNLLTGMGFSYATESSFSSSQPGIIPASSSHFYFLSHFYIRSFTFRQATLQCRLGYAGAATDPIAKCSLIIIFPKACESERPVIAPHTSGAECKEKSMNAATRGWGGSEQAPDL